MEDIHSETQESQSGTTSSESVRVSAVSGKASAAILVACLALTAVLIIPLARRFPPWIDFEIVLVGWWLVWVIALAILLYRGSQITDDHAHRGPRDWLAPFRKNRPSEKELSDWPWWIWAVPDGEGCVGLRLHSYRGNSPPCESSIVASRQRRCLDLVEITSKVLI